MASQQATRDAAHARHNAEEAFQEAQQFLEVTRAQVGCFTHIIYDYVGFGLVDRGAALFVHG